MTEPIPPTFVYEVTDVPASEGVTPWQTVGPYFHYALPYDSGPQVAGSSRWLSLEANASPPSA